MHAKPDLRVFLEWMIARSGSVITDVTRIKCMAESQSDRTKIEIHTPNDDLVDIETPWVDHLGDNRYRLMNLPFFAYGLSLGDVVRALPTGDGDLPVFQHVVNKSGRRLLRSRFKDTDGIDCHIEHFAQLGCLCEPILGDAVGIDVPADVPLGVIAAYLLEHAINWEFADPAYPQLYRSRKSRKYDPLHIDPSQRDGIYEGYYCSYSMGMDTGNGNLQRLGPVAIRVAFCMLIHVPKDFLWFSDANGVTFQFTKTSDDEFWCEFPDEERNGSMGTQITIDRLDAILRNLPEDLSELQNELELEFVGW